MYNENYQNQNEGNEHYELATVKKHKNSKMNKTLKKAGALVLSGALLGTVAGGTFAASSYVFPRNTVSSQEQISQSNTVNKTTLTSFSDSVSSKTASDASVQAIAQKGLPSVVAITNTGVTETMTMWGNMQQPSESCGSGIIIGETDDELLVVTNYHVIEGSQTLTVVFSYDEESENPDAVEAHIKGYDSKKDLAVIAISKDSLKDEMKDKISVAAVGNSSDLQLGEQVVAIGNALGYGQSVTTGIVSALNRQIESSQTGESEGNTYIQTDTAINPGNSGGALFNMKGELIGINTAKIASDQIEGMGYAIPISNVYNLIENMMNQTTRTEVVAQNDRGYLGISATDVDASVSSSYGIPEGVYVTKTDENGAAHKAGIKNGYVITAFDGKTVSTTSELQNLLTYYKKGETISVTVQVPSNSEYTEKNIDVTLGETQNPAA